MVLVYTRWFDLGTKERNVTDRKAVMYVDEERRETPPPPKKNIEYMP